MAHATPTPAPRPAPGPVLIDSGWTRHLEQLRDAFLAGYRSQATRNTYRDGLDRWLAFCAAHDVHPLQARRTHVELWCRTLEGAGYAPATRAIRLSAVKSFYGWLYAEELIEGNPAGLVKPPHRPDSNLPALDRHEAHRFIVNALKLGDERAAVLLTMLLTGIRVGEATSAKVTDLTEERFVTVLHVHGKGQRERTVPVPQLAHSAIIRAHTARRHPSLWLFLNTAGRPMTRHNVADAITKVLVAADITKRISPHGLRRSAVSIAFDAGGELRDIQLLAGHADPRTTTRYDRRATNPAKSPAFLVQAAVA